MKALYLSALDCSHDLISLRKGKYNWYLFVKRGGDFIQYFRLETFKGRRTHQSADFGDILPTLYIQTNKHTLSIEGRYMGTHYYKGECAYRFRGMEASLLIRERGGIGNLEDLE